MRKLLIGYLSVVALLMFGSANAATLKDKVITYSPGSYLAGQAIPLGVDPYGYNYQSHSFNGSYFNSYANGAGFPPYTGDDATYLAANPGAASHWAWPYRNDQLAMKWNEAWLSNQDRDGDGKLDRHYGYPTYVGSGAWLSNHQSGEYVVAGEEVSWNYFVKIVAVPADATKVGSVWLDSSGTEIGPVIWGEFAILQEVLNDHGTGDHGVSYHSPAGPGVGKY
ncbi:MAG: hypothetical protein Q7R88_00920 [bacterium]|nr:hypothetical protein [bacterium]